MKQLAYLMPLLLLLLEPSPYEGRPTIAGNWCIIERRPGKIAYYRPSRREKWIFHQLCEKNMMLCSPSARAPSSFFFLAHARMGCTLDAFQSFFAMPRFTPNIEQLLWHETLFCFCNVHFVFSFTNWTRVYLAHFNKMAGVQERTLFTFYRLI